MSLEKLSPKAKHKNKKKNDKTHVKSSALKVGET